MQKFLQIKQLIFIFLCTLYATLSFGQSSGDYRTKNTTGGPHAWATAGNWEKHNGTTWATATSAPTSVDGVITIRTGSSYTFSTGTVTVDQLTIENGGTLTYSGGTLTVADGTGDDLVINSGGTFVNSNTTFPANSTFVPTSTARVRVKSGGVWESTTNTSGNSDDWAFSSNTRCVWEDSATFRWTTTSAYNTATTTYFNTTATTDRPIWEFNANTLAGGAGSTTTWNGVIKVNSVFSITLQNSGTKVFRGGIWLVGSGTLNQASGCGEFRITGDNAYMIQTGTVTGSLKIHANNFAIQSGITTLRSNFKIDDNASGTSTSEMQIVGTLDFRGFYLDGSLESFEPRNNCELRTQNADGFLTSTTAGCIRFASAARAFQNVADRGVISYNANGNQTTSNNLFVANASDLYFTGSGTKTLTTLASSVSNITITGFLTVSGASTILSVPSAFTLNMNTTGKNFSLTSSATMNDNCLTNLNLINAFTLTGNYQLRGNGQTFKFNNLTASNSSTGQYLLSTTGGSTNLQIRNDFTTNFTSTSSLVDNANTITVGGNFIASGAGTSNYTLTGTVILNGAANATTVEVRNSSSAKVAFQFNNLTVDISTANPDVSIYPLAGGSYLTIKGNFTLTNIGTGKAFKTNGNHFRIRGDYTNSKGDAFLTESTSRFIFDGTATQSITTVGDSFNVLHCDKSAGVLEIKSNLGIKDSFDIKNGTVTTNSNGLKTVVIGGNGELKETSTAYITLGAVQTTKQLPQNTNVDFGNIGLKVNRKGSNNPGDVVFTRYTGASVVGSQTCYNQITNRSYDAMNMRWEIVPQNNGDLQADVEFRYIDALINGLDEVSMNVYRKGGGNAFTWRNKNGHNTTLNTLMETNTDSFSEWILGGSSTPLPVDLIYFQAKLYQKTNVNLTWSTASEINNSHFEIEKSTNGTDWSFVKSVQGNGTTNVLSTYNAMDKITNLTSKNIYYRLKQVDFDGHFEYSEIQEVLLKNDNLTQPEVFINHLTNTLTINTKSNLTHTYSIFDLSGKKVLDGSYFGDSNTLDVSNLTKGSYIISLINSDQQFTKQFIKL